jgi:aerobic carbon-monoxide dehydrogenase large subunit
VTSTPVLDDMVTALESRHGFIGSSLPRKEDRRFVQGKGQFTDDFHVRGMLHATFVRSPHAHARIRGIDVTAAAALPGVVAVVTGEDLARLTEPAVVAQEGAVPMVMETLPTTKVRFNGDPVACVIAEDRYVAEDAAELVEVDYDVLEPVLDMYTAADGPLVDEGLPSNLHTRQTKSYGDVAAAFAAADRVVEARFRAQRLTHVPIETLGVLAVWDAGREELTFYSGQQTAHVTRTLLASRLRLNENQVRVVSPDMGGGFGLKIPLFREELTVAAMAMKLARPIKWTEDRTENLMASNHARDDAAVVRAAVAKDGTVLGIQADLWADFGAYAFYPPSYIIDVVGWLLLGAYKVENYEYTINVAITNKCPSGTLRAPMALVTWATDGTIERVAEELGLDPLDVRRRNMIRLQDQPYRSAPGYLYESLTLRESFDEMLERFDLDAFRQTQEAARAEGRLLGVGIASVLEPTTYGSAWYKASGDEGSGHEAATVKLEPSGAINVMVGIIPSGQGYETTIAQVVAEALGSTPDNVSVRLGDTHVVPYGMGSRGSRGAAAGNGVAYLAALDLKNKALRIAAHVVGEPVDALEIVGDQIYVVGEAEPRLPLAHVARIAYMDPTALPPGVEPGLEIHRTYDPPQLTFSNATHLAVVEVDSDTGRVDILDYRVVEDAGTLINPMIVDGQVHGGVVMGIGQALFEETVYDEAGTNVTTSFLDYLIPTIDTVPVISVHHIETPNPNTPRGIKGMAEGPVQGGVASVALAVGDALRCTGARVEALPLNPRRVLGLLRESGWRDRG